VNYLDIPVEQFEDEDLVGLINEMSAAAPAGSAFRSQRFIPFLIGSQKPWANEYKRTPFHPKHTLPGFLERPLRTIESESNSIAELCRQLAALIDEPFEMHINQKLMTFLNSVVLHLDRRARASAKKPKKRR